MAKRRKTRNVQTRRSRTQSAMTMPGQLTFVNLGLGFPKQVKMTHKYRQLVTLTSPSGNLASQAFRANGMFDPDYNLGSHQPMFFDQIGALYNHYTVIGSKLTANIGGWTSNIVPMTVGLCIDDDATLNGNIDAILESGKCKKLMTQANSQNPTMILSMGWSAKNTFGGEPMSIQKLQGTPVSDPAEGSYFVLFTQSNDLVSSQSLFIDVEIEYIAQWTELKSIGSS